MIEIRPLASGSAGNCYWISDGKTPLLLECGIPIREIKKGLDFRLSEVAGCLISHEHFDHCLEFFQLIKHGIDVYMSPGTIEALNAPDMHRLHKVKPKRRYEIGSWIVKPLKAQHDAAEPLNFLLWSKHTGEKLVYLTDTFYTRYKFHEPNYIMVECNYSKDILDENIRKGVIPPAMKKRLLQSHMSLKTVKDFLRANDLSQVREIWLLHLSDNNSDADRFKREVQELTGKPVYVAGGD